MEVKQILTVASRWHGDCRSEEEGSESDDGLETVHGELGKVACTLQTNARTKILLYLNARYQASLGEVCTVYSRIMSAVRCRFEDTA